MPTHAFQTSRISLACRQRMTACTAREARQPCRPDSDDYTPRPQFWQVWRCSLLPNSNRLCSALPTPPHWSRPSGRHVCSMLARMSRYRPAPPGTRRQRNRRSHGKNGTIRHYPAVAGRRAAALNSRVRGSSPWRRTRSDLGLCTPGRFRFRVGMGRGWPWYGRVPESRLRHRVRAAPPGRDSSAQPVLIDVRILPARPADLPARVSAAGAGLPPPAAVAEPLGLAGPGGAGD